MKDLRNSEVIGQVICWWVLIANVCAQLYELLKRFQVLVDNEAATRSGFTPFGQETTPVLLALLGVNFTPAPPMW